MTGYCNPVVEHALNNDLGGLRYALMSMESPDTPLEDGTTPLHAAARLGHVTAVDMLLAFFANPHVTDNTGATPFMVAANGTGSCEQRIEIMAFFVKKGADINIADQALMTPLMHAAEQGDEDILCFLLNHGADTRQKNLKDQDALALARVSNHPGCCKLITAAQNKSPDDLRDIRKIVRDTENLSVFFNGTRAALKPPGKQLTFRIRIKSPKNET